jgi:hypothetical protein
MWSRSAAPQDHFRAVLKLMFDAAISAAEDGRSVKISAINSADPLFFVFSDDRQRRGRGK